MGHWLPGLCGIVGMEEGLRNRPNAKMTARIIFFCLN